MGSVAIKPLNVSSHVLGDMTLVFLPKSSCLRDLSSGSSGVNLTSRVLMDYIEEIRAQSRQRFIVVKEKAQPRALS
jgi:hypothetical protein